MTRDNSSTEYKKLKKRINEIKKHFDFKQNTTGPTKEQEDKLRGFILLCHAEFENYFEKLALEILEKAEKNWTKKRIANYNLASLFINSSIKKDMYCITLSMKIISDFKKSMEGNNGIKETNLKNMFEPLGVYIDSSFDSVFIASLNSFGVERGKIAHASTIGTREVLDKKNKFETVEYLLDQIIIFEKEVKNYKGNKP